MTSEFSKSLISEGKAKIIVNDVFYNPKMKFCRDVDMKVFEKLNADDYLDALSATGIRGIRAYLEASYNPIFNDKDKKAVKTIKMNLKLNKIEAEVLNEDANVLMRRRSFTHIDIDPFGSPSMFIDSACYSAKKYMSVTATDTAALCGSAITSGLRKYSSFVEKTEYYHELGLRNLIGKIAREITKYDKAIDVLISWGKEHYYRVHLKIKRSTRLAGELYKRVGYIFHCRKCGFRDWKSFEDEQMERHICSICNEKMRMYGPLWIGELHNIDFIKRLEKKGEVGELFKRIEEEIDIVTYYNTHNIACMLKTSPPPLDDLINYLKEVGYKASKTRFGGSTFKTDASIIEIKKAFTSLK